jgi:hypothetical protein
MSGSACGLLVGWLLLLGGSAASWAACCVLRCLWLRLVLSVSVWLSAPGRRFRFLPLWVRVRRCGVSRWVACRWWF